MATVGFIVVAGMAMAILAAVVLLPAYQQRNEALYNRDALAAQVRTNDRLIAYNNRLIDATKNDPLLTQRLLMQQQNFHISGEVAVPVDAPQDPPIAAALAAATPAPKPPPPILESLSRRVEEPSTRRGMLALAGLLMVGAMILFAPPDDSDKPRRRLW